VGYSFSDPAIVNVFDTVRKTVGDIHAGRHIALVPNNIDQDLAKLLTRSNVEQLRYDAANDHAKLWTAVGGCCLTKVVDRDDLVVVDASITSYMRKFLASGYARNRLKRGRTSLRAAIFEGLVVELIQTSGALGVTLAEITAGIREKIGVRSSEALDISRDCVGRLVAEGLCVITGKNVDAYKWIGDLSETNGGQIDDLSDGVLNRYVVRFGGKSTQELHACVCEIIERMLVTRGWDLGAAFASKRPPDEVELDRILDGFNDQLIDAGAPRPSDVLMSLKDLLSRPNPAEAGILSELGRISFALELALVAPHGTLFHTLTLPQRIYLDANVLLPAIVAGHPFFDVYSHTISRLVDAAA
jgi:hypothetical protein